MSDPEPAERILSTRVRPAIAAWVIEQAQREQISPSLWLRRVLEKLCAADNSNGRTT